MDRKTVEQFQLLMEGIADYAVFLLDRDGLITSWPSAAEKLFGHEAKNVEGQSLSILYPSTPPQNHDYSVELRMAAAHGRFEDVSWRVRKDGTLFWAESVICPIREDDGEIRGFSLIIRDVTERRKSEETIRQKEEELAQARKMEAIGRLAGGVAHDFNNFITGIMGLAEEVRESLPPNDERREDLSQIINTADRARLLTRELLAFGRRQASSPQIVNLNALLQDKHKILLRWLGGDIEMNTRLDSGIGNILIDPTQLDQILVNLVVNARDAMPQGGRLQIETGRVMIEKDSTTHLRPGPYVSLRLRDSGFGMDESVLPHIFEPFFTTKGQGKGTGLGLATVYGIVKQNQGDITVKSTLGLGSEFLILLPEIDAPVKSESAPPKGIQTQGVGTVLVVEDEDVVRRVTQRALEKSGYHVLLASSGAAALELGRNHNAPIHLLLTDVVMPEMNGRVLADQFRKIHPETLVLYMSAYSEQVIHQRGILESGLAFLEKPFTREVLTSKVAAELQKRHSPTPK
jgi:PAS domain S-box-containing protein